MITKITLPLQLPFDAEQATIDGLNRVCFLFGPNGSGKTTISQLIADEAINGASSILQWDSVAPTRTYVYNRKFISTNFADSFSIPGVFTMGKGMIDAQKKIEELTEAIDKDRDKRDGARTNLEQAKADLDRVEADIRDVCWGVRSEMPEIIRRNWSGTGRKDQFRDDLVVKIGAIKSSDQLPDIDELKRRVAVIFDDSVTSVSDLPVFDYHPLLISEDADIFKKPIVGKDDIAIGSLIKRLGNSDWVAQGQKYIDGDVCPFCQQRTLTDELKDNLEDFFDESYKTDKNELERASQEYETSTESTINVAAGVIGTHADFFDAPILRTQIAELRRVVQSNRSLLAEKLAEPSRSITLGSVKSICEEISRLFNDAGIKVREHNEMIRDRADQKDKAIADMWLYAAMTAKTRIGPLQQNEANGLKGIDGLKKQTENIDNRISKNTEELQKAEESLTNVKETADAINGLLIRFGFTNFKVAVSEDGKHYRIERNDGTSVNDTLSEGESSFLTFLYFYHLMNGSLETTGTTDRRVVVIDDPITSMDADVLFVVSSLVRQLENEARDGSSKTEQLIVLTHNITFHREITYIRGGEGDKKTSYYVIRKAGGHSKIERCVNNPVSSTYELLWTDLCRSDCSSLTAQNISRRITETFFKLVGGLEPDDIIAAMSSPDREVARSFMSWAHAGSHSPFDDETFVNSTETTDVYRRVLGLVFENAGYEKHYKEMIAKCSERANQN